MAQFLKISSTQSGSELHVEPSYLEPYSTTEQVVGHWVNDAHSLIYIF